VARLLTASAAALALLLAACGGDDRKEAQQTVRDFVKATNERDADRFCDELATQEYLEQSTGATGDQAREECKRQFEAVTGLELELVSIRKTEVDGDRARVMAELSTQGVREVRLLRLEKEDGDWKLAGGSGQ
jgi:predicted lipid-binding transport protein (Tim44 family)